MNEFQAFTEQHELLATREPAGLTQVVSDSTAATGHCDKKQRLIDEINQLTAQRDKHLNDAEQHHAKMAPLEALLEGDEVIEEERLTEIRKEHSSLKVPYDASKHRAWLLDAKISRREQLLNHETLMAGYNDSMVNWRADELELNEKRCSLSTRLAQIQLQAEEDIAKARQAETDAATAYAQAVAWGDTEGEKNANADAQKAAKNLAMATEHNRRQHLIITALEQELATVDLHIVEAQREYLAIQRTALFLAEKVLEEQWNEKAQELIDFGAKLWAVQRMLGGDQLSLRRLVLPKEGEGFDAWGSRELSERSGQYDIQNILSS
ncbi:chromosome segregation protein SMC [Pseudomonas sp. R45(2017)]|uniref:chromosome segregation protein SMC n=1 Tax=Pseudomonas sp. R45(2017) TaxID=1981678 RepID=UPI00211540AD|nr:chromosome segregation protein SMC [Pseudomonas sp. R45(2017)]